MSKMNKPMTAVVAIFLLATFPITTIAVTWTGVVLFLIQWMEKGTAREAWDSMQTWGPFYIPPRRR